MLVLTRKEGEELVWETAEGIITLRLIEIRGNKARLGIVAPRKVPVFRKEVYDKLQPHERRRYDAPED